MPNLPASVYNFAVGHYRNSATKSVVYANCRPATGTANSLIVIDPAVSTTTWRDVTAAFPASDRAYVKVAPSNKEAHVVVDIGCGHAPRNEGPELRT